MYGILYSMNTEQSTAPTYEVVITKSAAKGIKRLDKQVQRIVMAAIADLATEPRPANAKALTGPLTGLTRLRISAAGGEYRVLYGIDDKVHVVTVENVGSREDIGYE